MKAHLGLMTNWYWVVSGESRKVHGTFMHSGNQATSHEIRTVNKMPSGDIEVETDYAGFTLDGKSERAQPETE